jgi:hypothetical protein
MPRQFRTFQFDLFSSVHSGKTSAMPQWQTLPEGTRQALTALIVRLHIDTQAATAPPSRRRPVMMHEKTGPHHLEPKAILYVRQSSAHQVLHNREVATFNYAMRDRFKAFG